MAIEADLEASREGEGYRKVWARLRVCRDIRVARKRCSAWAREQSALAPSLPRRGGNPHDGEIITCPEPHVATERSTGGPAGAGSSSRRALNECAGCMSASRRRFESRSPWGLPGCMARPRRRGRGWPCDAHGPGICQRLHQPTVRGMQAVLAFVAGPRHGVAERFNRTLYQSSMVALPQHRGAAGRRPRLRRTLQCPVERRKERLPEPRSSSSGVARRDLNQARRVRQTCVQGTGCATVRPAQMYPAPRLKRVRPSQ